MRLAELLHPLAPADFFQDHWEQQPVLASGPPERLAGVVSSRELDQIIRCARPRVPEGIVLIKGNEHYARNWSHADGTARVERVQDAWREGYTLVLNRVHTMWPPVAALAESLEEELHHPVGANLYFTPPQSQGFAAHYDVMDVLVVQLEGVKAWRVRGAYATLPLADEQGAVDPARLPPVVLEAELVPGSVLYIPRGFVHEAATNATASLHLTLGIQVVTWIDLLAAAVAGARRDERLRKALPPGFLHDRPEVRGGFAERLAAMTTLGDVDGALQVLAERLIGSKPPPLGTSFAAPPDIDADTPVRRLDGALCRVLEGPGYAGIRYPGGSLMGPAKLAPALRYIATQRELTARSLPGGLGDNEKLVLVRRLLRDRLLVVAGTDAGQG